MVSFQGAIYTPSPLWDLEYADEIVLLSNSGEQLTRIFHLIQFQGSIRGLHLNEEKRQYLRLNSDQRVYYAPSTLIQNCPCSLCLGHSRMGDQVPLSQEVKYLGVSLHASGSARKNVSFRITQVIHSSKLFKPLLAHFMETYGIWVNRPFHPYVCYGQYVPLPFPAYETQRGPL